MANATITPESHLPDIYFCHFQQLSVRRLHISSAVEIKKFCEDFLAEFKQLNILVVNAVHLSTKSERTVEGFERNMGLNYVASFLITQHLLPLLERSAMPDTISRVIFVSSRLHKYGELPTALTTTRVDPKDYSWWKAYTSSHLALITYANYLNTRVDPSKTRIVSVHPGFENRHFGSVLPEVSGSLITKIHMHSRRTLSLATKLEEAKMVRA